MPRSHHIHRGRIAAALSIAIAVLSSAGCATGPDVTRLAQVEQVSSQAAADHGQLACSQLLGHEPAPGEQLVLASYSFGGSPSLRTRQWVAVPASAVLAPGDQIRLAPGACAVKASAKG